MNERGRRLVEFCLENNLVILNKWFKLHRRRLYTWRSPENYIGKVARNEIDIITIDKMFCNGVISKNISRLCDNLRSKSDSRKYITKTKVYK